MKSKERHQLKQNDFAESALRVITVVGENRNYLSLAVLAVVVVLGVVGGFFIWRNARADSAGSLLAVATSTASSPIAPPSSLPGAKQAPGTFVSEKARSEAALKAYQDVIAAYPSSEAAVTAKYQAAAELLDLGRFGEAETLFNEVSATRSSVYAPMARLGLAQAKLLAGKYDEAVKLYTDLAGERDSAVPVDGVLMQLAQAYTKAGKSQDARAAYKRVVDEFADSVYAPEARQQLAN